MAGELSHLPSERAFSAIRPATMSLRTTIHSHFVLPLLRHAYTKGVAPEKVLTAAGLPGDVADKPRMRFTTDQYARIVRQLWKELNDEFFAMSAQPIRFGTLSLFCELALRESTVGAALQKQAECFKLATRDIRWHLKTAGDHAVLSVTIDPRPTNDEHVLVEYMLCMTYRFAGWLAGRRIALTRVWFDFPKPDYADEYNWLFDGPCLFGQSMAALEFPRECLAWPTVRTKKELLPILRASPAGILVDPVTDTNFVIKVRRLLLGDDKYNLDFPTFESVADALRISPGTLRRRLKTEGTSYQALKDDIRRDIAIELLADRGTSVFAVASALGYVEASTFSRAFKSWTGLSPAAYRSQHDGAEAPEQ